jgi:hypothetical protein
MGKMPLHEFLINLIGAAVLNIVHYPSAPIAPSGVLGSKFGYAIRLPKFGAIVEELMKKKGAKIPDLLLVNEEKKLLIIVECKSDFTFKIEEKLSKQIEFYSSKDFKVIWKEMFPDLTNIEIWVFSPKGLSGKISDFISRQVITEKLANVVVWGVEHKKTREEAHIQKFYGNHLDSKLNEKMERGGFVCSPPRIELLIDPTLTDGQRVFRIGRRLFSFVASSHLTEKDRIVTLRDFRETHPDAIMTDRELKRCLRYLLKLVPEIGKYNSATGEVVLAKRPSLNKIKTKLENIGNMTDEEIKIELVRISTRITVGGVKHPRTPQKAKISDWFSKKKAISKSSHLTYFVHDVGLLDREGTFL